MVEFSQQFLSELKNTGFLEFTAVIFGIASVWFSKKENILVYPVGLVNTIIYIYMSFKAHLFGEGTVNVYYTIVSIYGWVLWSKKTFDHRPAIKIMFSDKREWMYQFAFFTAMFLLFYFSLRFLKAYFNAEALPAPDAFATAAAFTGMWLMARKKVESWYWWIATNIASIPLFYIKGFTFTSVYYFILLIMAISGLITWSKKAAQNRNVPLSNI